MYFLTDTSNNKITFFGKVDKDNRTLKMISEKVQVSDEVVIYQMSYSVVTSNAYRMNRPVTDCCGVDMTVLVSTVKQKLQRCMKASLP